MASGPHVNPEQGPGPRVQTSLASPLGAHSPINLGIGDYDPSSEAWSLKAIRPAGIEEHGDSPAENDEVAQPYVSSWSIYFLLILTGAFVSFIVFCLLTVVHKAIDYQALAAAAAYERWGHLAGLGAWVACGTTITACAFLSTSWCPEAVGSGIPEMKVEIRGLHLKKFFTRRVLSAKAFGLALGQGAGLPIGKEGPFVHFAACVSDALLKSGFFVSARRAGRVRKVLLTASIAIGVGASFSVPIAGVLFALEAMPDRAWHNTTYWSCLAGAITSSITSRIISSVWSNNVGTMLPPVFSSDLGPTHLSPVKDPASHFPVLCLSVALGAFCGVLGASFTILQQLVARRLTRWRLNKATAGNRWVWNHVDFDDTDDQKNQAQESGDYLGVNNSADAETIVLKNLGAPLLQQQPEKPAWLTVKQRSLLLCMGVAALNSCLSYLVPPLRATQSTLLGSLFSSETLDFSHPLDSTPGVAFWGQHSELAGLGASLAVKLLTTVLALSLPLPTGCIAPAYVLGALIGRIFGHFANEVGDYLGMAHIEGVDYEHVLPAHFAMIGAAAFGSALCRSFSLAVAIFELVPIEAVLVPVSAATITSILVANTIGPSIFDAILATKGLPAPLQFRTFRHSLRPVASVMRRKTACVHRYSSLKDLEAALQRYQLRNFFAVLNKHGKLTGAVTASHLTWVQNWLKGASVEEVRAALPADKAAKLFAQVAEGEPFKIADVLKAPGSGGEVQNVTPLQVPPHMALEDLAVLFIMHRCEVAFVTDKCGTLLGVITISDLKDPVYR